VQLTGVSFGELGSIVHYVSAQVYGGNVNLSSDSRPLLSKRARRVRWTLRVQDSRGPGARQSLSWSRTPDGERRRTVAACWHAHADIMLELFEQFPRATLRSVVATYGGRDDYLAKSEGTYWRNAGSLMSPVFFGDLCDCTDTGPATAHSHVDMGHDAERTDYFLMPSIDAMRWSPASADDDELRVATLTGGECR
jgi:hypothetical protein